MVTLSPVTPRAVTLSPVIARQALLPVPPVLVLLAPARAMPKPVTPRAATLLRVVTPRAAASTAVSTANRVLAALAPVPVQVLLVPSSPQVSAANPHNSSGSP